MIFFSISTIKKAIGQMKQFLFKACRDGQHEKCAAVIGSDVDELDGKPHEFGDPCGCSCVCHLRRLYDLLAGYDEQDYVASSPHVKF